MNKGSHANKCFVCGKIVWWTLTTGKKTTLGCPVATVKLTENAGKKVLFRSLAICKDCSAKPHDELTQICTDYIKKLNHKRAKKCF